MLLMLSLLSSLMLSLLVLSLPMLFMLTSLLLPTLLYLLLLKATYLVDCLTDKTKDNKILNIGGPDNGLTMTDQGKLVSSNSTISSTFFFAHPIPLHIFFSCFAPRR